MVDLVCPENETELAALVTEAAETQTSLEICGAGSKRDIGRPVEADAVLSTSELKGITYYEPGERILQARAGTPLKHIVDSLAEHGQELAFEPVDLAPLFGAAPWQGTIAAVFAANLCGPRGLVSGAPARSCIALRAVNGRGDVIRHGGRTVRSVAGYDLRRMLGGSWGTLAVVSEVAMRVTPKTEAATTVILRDCEDEVAVEAMCAAMGAPLGITGAVHLQAGFLARLSGEMPGGDGGGLTAFRLDSTSAALLSDRAVKLVRLMSPFGDADTLDADLSDTFWSEIAGARYLSRDASAIWRVCTAPRRAARLVSLISRTTECGAVYDWAGGQIWLEVPARSDAAAVEIRQALSEIRGHATLIKAPQELRAVVDVFQPAEPRLETLTRRLKYAFDPKAILNPGRMYPGV